MPPTRFNQMSLPLRRSISTTKHGWGSRLEKSRLKKLELSSHTFLLSLLPNGAEAKEVDPCRAAECEAPLQFVTAPYDATRSPSLDLIKSKMPLLQLLRVRAAKIAIDESAIVCGLANIEWPARFQRWDKRTIIDGAHNAGAARALAETWREIFSDQRATSSWQFFPTKICVESVKPLHQSAIMSCCQGSAVDAQLAPEDLANALPTITPPLVYSVAASIDDALATGCDCNPHPF